VDAAADPDDRDSAVDVAGWDLVRRVGRGGLSEAGRVAARWATDRLEHALGGSWPARQYEAHRRIPDPFLRYAGNRTSLHKLLALSTRIDRFADEPSLHAVLTALKATPDDATWRHCLLQLEVARAGVAVGAAASFEPRIPGHPGRGDVLLRWDDETQMVETSTLSRADRARSWEDYEKSIREPLHAAALDGSLRVEVSMRDHPDAAEASTWVDNALGAARRAAQSGISIVLENDWITATFTPDSNTPGITEFEGAPHFRDAWVRMGRMLRDKIRQTAGAENVWLRIDDHDSLFIFTDWARSPLPDRIARITDAIRDVPNTAADGITLDHDHVACVVLSSGLLTIAEPLDAAQNQTARAEGAALLRRTLASHLSRDTVVVAFATAHERSVERWRGAYDTEASWLDEDLDARGFAPFADLFD
jgi:hypothetical protein